MQSRSARPGQRRAESIRYVIPRQTIVFAAFSAFFAIGCSGSPGNDADGAAILSASVVRPGIGYRPARGTPGHRSRGPVLPGTRDPWRGAGGSSDRERRRPADGHPRALAVRRDPEADGRNARGRRRPPVRHAGHRRALLHVRVDHVAGDGGRWRERDSVRRTGSPEPDSRGSRAGHGTRSGVQHVRGDVPGPDAASRCGTA